jgi:hypothetical protein
MNLANIIKLTVSLSGARAEIIVPAHIDNRGNWFVNASIPVFNSTFSVKLATTRHNNYPPSRPMMPNAVLRWKLIGGEYAIRYSADTAREGREAILGIHPHSSLVRGTGSVALIRSSVDGHNQDGKMVIGSRLSSFNATCVPGTYMRFGSESGEVSVRIAGKEVTTKGVQFHDDASYRQFLHVPQEIVARLHALLVGLGASQSHLHEYQFFTNCPSSLIPFLPPIEIETRDFGKISFGPAEYMHFNPEDEGCLPKVGAFPGVYLHPFRLPGFNVRVSNDYTWEICRSAA